ncbi:MAG: NAD(P)/FAD-dependent oxidoreductase, partial [Beijerinckiaceae bacterium]
MVADVLHAETKRLSRFLDLQRFPNYAWRLTFELGMNKENARTLSIAVVGSGIAGLSAAWLLSQRHHVTLYEKDERLGGHSHTVQLPEWAGGGPVDTGFIVFNPQTYPNLVALFKHLGIETANTDMSFGVSLEEGAFEYSGGSWAGLFAQKSNIISLRFWLMLHEIWRFYRNAPRWIADSQDLSLDELLDQRGFTRVIRDDHLYPMAAAIWSMPAKDIGRKPAVAFIRFCENHGLLKLRDRPIWKTVRGGSMVYVDRLRAESPATFITGHRVTAVIPDSDSVTVYASGLEPRTYDHVIMSAHADDALSLLPQASDMERMI